MSQKEDLERAVLAMRGLPIFDEFIKTLAARREAVVERWVAGGDDADSLRGEVRAYDYILKAISRHQQKRE